MRRLALVVLALALGTAVTACSRDDEQAELAPREFCEAAARLDLDVGTAAPERQLELVAAVAAVAPPEVKADADTFHEGMRRVVGDGEEITDEAERTRYEEASNRLQRFSIDHCALLKQGGSSPFSGNN